MARPKAPVVPKILGIPAPDPEQAEIDEVVRKLNKVLSHPHTIQLLNVLADIGIGGSCSLRDRFAAAAAQGLTVAGHTITTIPQSAYMLADRMLAYRKLVSS